jgi:hypothetical protein
LSAKLTKKISMGMSFQISEFYFTFCWSICHLSKEMFQFTTEERTWKSFYLFRSLQRTWVTFNWGSFVCTKNISVTNIYIVFRFTSKNHNSLFHPYRNHQVQKCNDNWFLYGFLWVFWGKTKNYITLYLYGIEHCLCFINQKLKLYIYIYILQHCCAYL